MSIANETNINEELRRTSMGFGELITQVGQGVARTTLKLTETGSAAISALATTQVNVIAAHETTYDDAGQVTGHTAFTQKLPLINFVDPVIYQWSNVRVQGTFFARELSTATSESYGYHQSKEGYGQGGLFVIFGGGYNRFSYSGQYGSSQTLHDTDTSVGAVRLNALLEPRYDVGVPKPTQVVVGPSIQIMQGQVQEETSGNVLNARTMEVLLEYRRADGTAIPNKELSVEADGIAWQYLVATSTRTDTDGRVKIVLRREFLDPDADTAPKPFILTARKGLVNTNLSVTL